MPFVTKWKIKPEHFIDAIKGSLPVTPQRNSLKAFVLLEDGILPPQIQEWLSWRLIIQKRLSDGH